MTSGNPEEVLLPNGVSHLGFSRDAVRYFLKHSSFGIELLQSGDAVRPRFSGEVPVGRGGFVLESVSKGRTLRILRSRRVT